MLENSAVVPQMVIHGVIPYDLVILLPVISPRNENICHKNLYAVVYSSIIHNILEVETTQMSISEQLDKQNVLYPFITRPYERLK